MLVKKLGALFASTILLATVNSVRAEEIQPRSVAPATQSKEMPADAKLRLAQRVQSKQQEQKEKPVLAKPQEEQKTKPGLTKPKEEKKAPTAIKKQVPAKQGAIPVKTAPKSRLELRMVHPDGTPATAAELARLKKNPKKNNKINLEERAFYMDVMLPVDYKEITIVGKPTVTKEQAAAYIKQNNPRVKLSCSVEKLMDFYWQESSHEGIRPDLVVCQAITETGFFNYGGDVIHNQNNFCGLGTTGGGVRGASFKTPQLGARAHIQHLLAYARKERPKTTVVDPRYDLAHNLRLSKGLIHKWYGLNGTWAMGQEYCEKIMYHYARMQKVQVAATTPVPAVKQGTRGRFAKNK